MSRSSNEMLRDMLALVRDLKMDAAENRDLVAEVAAYLANLNTAPPSKPPKQIVAEKTPLTPEQTTSVPTKITIKR